MNKHLLTTFFTAFILVLTSYAQSLDLKFGIEVNGGIREYGGDRGSAMYFRVKPEYQAVGFGFNYYLNSSFDASVYGSIGDLGYYDKDHLGFRARITDVLLGLNYKLYNGYIFSEDALFKPYIKAGWGGMQSVAKIEHGIPGYSKSRTWFAAHWNAGAGVRIRLTPNIDLTLQELYNYSFDDNYDGLPFQYGSARLNTGTDGNKPLHDAYLYHSIGFVYNFGGTATAISTGRTYKIRDKDQDGVPDKIDECPNTPEGYRVDSLGCPFDTDGDGIINEEDKCPKEAGPAENNGCPVVVKDADKDGVNDDIDKCANTPAGYKVDANGCPFDKDSDGVVDEEDKCPDEAGTIANSGCPPVEEEAPPVEEEIKEEGN